MFMIQENREHSQPNCISISVSWEGCASCWSSIHNAVTPSSETCKIGHLIQSGRSNAVMSSWTSLQVNLIYRHEDRHWGIYFSLHLNCFNQTLSPRSFKLTLSHLLPLSLKPPSSIISSAQLVKMCVECWSVRILWSIREVRITRYWQYEERSEATSSDALVAFAHTRLVTFRSYLSFRLWMGTLPSPGSYAKIWCQ